MSKKRLVKPEFNKEIEKQVKLLSDGDDILREIICFHLSYRKCIDSVVHDGIVFYRVGHNSTHEYYLGRKNGETWKYVVGESLREDKWGIPLVEYRMAQVTDFGYCGHF